MLAYWLTATERELEVRSFFVTSNFVLVVPSLLASSASAFCDLACLHPTFGAVLAEAHAGQPCPWC